MPDIKILTRGRCPQVHRWDFARSQSLWTLWATPRLPFYNVLPMSVHTRYLCPRSIHGDEKLTTALLDRLTHHAHILTTRGESYRSNKRKAQTDRAPPHDSNPP
jgi:hypothetical protein